MNSRRKGKEGELELVEFLAKFGINGRRSQQYRGTDDSADLSTDLMAHIECKRTQRSDVHQWIMDVVAEDHESGRVPVVFWRKNKGFWVGIFHGNSTVLLLKLYTLVIKKYPQILEEALCRENTNKK